MTDHKFTDEENILFLLKTSDDIYASVKLSPEEAKILLALINRQKAQIESLNAIHADALESLRLASEANKDMQAEIERLIKANNRDDLQHKYCNLIEDVLVYSKSLEDYNKFRKSFKSEAIKEFAERLKSHLIIYTYINFNDAIDTLVKEMTEELK